MFGESFFLKEPYRKTFIVCDSKKRSCVAGFGLRCLFAACSSSVLRPLFAARPASRRGLRTALPLRGVLVLGASHPFLRPAPLRVAGFGLRCLFAACSSSVLRTLIAARPAVFFSLPLFRQRKTPGTAFPPPGGLLIVAYFFTVFWAMPRIWEIVQPYSLQVTTLPQ